MRQMTKTNKIFGAVAGAAMAVGGLFAANDAQAAQPFAKGSDCVYSQDVLPTNATFRSDDYSSLSSTQTADMVVLVGDFAERGGVGVLVVVADDLLGKEASSGNVITPEYLGGLFKRKLDNANVPSLVCYGYSESFTTTSAVIGMGSDYLEGNMTAADAYRKLDSVIEDYLASRGLASLDIPAATPN
ncbi:hypothetical protein [Salipiger abyssi]|uniref:hypothetical protein n=1 Tax=Salipiger abyssi TaxID=1250539 RepID=UPI001A8DB5DB|nr:hypothetical protein [Salipiger abyssi]MBN9890156.1 hypothetical protein [Salipiger abyssi]